MATLLFMMGAFFASCSTSEEKVERAENNVIKANNELDSANKAYQADVDAYRKETADKIAANNLSIAQFNARIESQKEEAREDYKKKISALEQKNSDMKKRMDDYKADGKDKWQIFKAEFSHDMDELGKTFKKLTTKK